MDLGGIAPDPALAGKSLLPCVRDPQAEAPHDYIFASWPKPGIRMIRSTDWKYVLHEDGAEELYEISTDPHEAMNLAGLDRTRSVSDDLRKALASHLKRTRDPFPVAVLNT
jgi:arylsulfatase A-like enzyme